MGLFKKKKIEKVVLSKEELKKFKEEKKSNEPEYLAQVPEGGRRIQNIKINEYDSKNPLIPAGGTTNWMTACDKFGYDLHSYYTEPNPTVINIAHDCKISIENVRMKTENKPFFTCVNFAKKEIAPHVLTTEGIIKEAINGPTEYERQFHFYYPYGTMFDLKMIEEVGYGLNALINESRFYDRRIDTVTDVYHNLKNEIIKLFIDGCSDKDAVTKILNSARLSKWNKHSQPVLPCRDNKDWISDLFESKYLKSKKQESQPE